MPDRSSAQRIAAIAGVRIGVAAAGISRKDRDDVAVFSLDHRTAVAGVFTRSKAVAAPVAIARRHLEAGDVRALVVNSGNANAGLGEQGEQDCMAVCEAVSQQLGLPVSSVLPFSTGVIGERLPAESICAHLPDAVDSMSEEQWREAACAIMTTDTFAKVASRQVALSNGQVAITGIAKGSGMIHPDMATMLAFIATDAGMSRETAKSKLLRTADESFNRITVDGDTSTNDACMLMATGASGCALGDDSEQRDHDRFDRALREVLCELAELIVRDGEGATKFVSVEVASGRSEGDCLKAAFAVAGSLLVKTAIFAGDPNWGRIYAAIGRSGVDGLDMSEVNIGINGVTVMTRGARDPEYRESMGVQAMSGKETHIRIELGMGNCAATVLTSDLSYEYIRINADYRS